MEEEKEQNCSETETHMTEAYVLLSGNHDGEKKKKKPCNLFLSLLQKDEWLLPVASCLMTCLGYKKWPWKEGKLESTLCQAPCCCSVGLIWASWERAGAQMLPGEKLTSPPPMMCLFTHPVGQGLWELRRQRWEKSPLGFGLNHCSGFCGCLSIIHFFPYG